MTIAVDLGRKATKQTNKRTVVPRPLSNDPRLFQCIYCYSHASKRFVEVYIYANLKLRKEKYISGRIVLYFGGYGEKLN